MSRTRFVSPLFISLAATAAVAAATAAALPARADGVTSTPADRSTLALTVYSNGTSLVEEHRHVGFAAGETTLSFQGVSDDIVPASILAVPIGAPGNLVQQSYAGTVADATTLLRASVGRTVTVVRDNNGVGQRLTATVLRATPQPLFEINGQVVTDINGRIEFDSLPPDLPLRPTVTATFSGTAAGNGEVALRYLTSGLSWNADHVIEVATDTHSLSLTTLATLSNDTGASWTNADLALIAGQVNPGPEAQEPVAEDKVARPIMALAAAPVGAPPPREAIGGYYLYHVTHAVTLPDGATEQIGLLSAPKVQAEIHYISNPTDDFRVRIADVAVPATHPAQILSFVNDAKTGPGVPLPAGTARVYARDSRGLVRFLGADLLPATAVGDKAELNVGEAFDLTIRQRQTDFQRPAANTTETGHEVTVSNAANEARTVRVYATLDNDWSILQESEPHVKETSNRAYWDVAVPAGGQTVLTYRVRMKF